MVHAADLNPFGQNILDVYNNQLCNGFFSRYTMSNSIAATAVTLVTPSLAEGTGLGLSLSAGLLTLGAGIWEVNYHLWCAGAATSTVELAICNDATATITAANTYVNGFFPPITSSVGPAGTIGTNIRSTGSAVVSFKVNNPSAAITGTPVLSRITFMRESSS